MSKKDDKKPKLASVHNIEDFRPVIDLHKEEAAVPNVQYGLCRNGPLLRFDRQDQVGQIESFTFMCFDAADIHGVTDLVSIQPTELSHDFIILEAPCCTPGFALTPDQVLALISALQAAYREAKKA